MKNKDRIAWIEILRVTSAFGILFYHTGLYYTHYAFSPKPDGILANWQHLLTVLSDKFGNTVNNLFGFISLFGFQFLDVFILLIGLAMVLSWRGEEDYFTYLKRRWLRILWPFWMAVFFSFVLSAAHHYMSGGYMAGTWHWFVAFTYPLAYDFHGSLLQQISGPWWFIPFMLAVIVVSPFMLTKLETWGIKHFLWFFGVLSMAYRLMAIYFFGAHTNYSTIATTVAEAPFLLLPAKLFLIALGMFFGKLIKTDAIKINRINLFLLALILYVIGFLAQFSWLGWTIAEFFYAPAIVILFYCVFSSVKYNFFTSLIVKLGNLSYSFFLIHNFFCDRLSHYFGDQPVAFWQTVILSTFCALVVALLIEKLIPIVSTYISHLWLALDKKLSNTCEIT